MPLTQTATNHHHYHSPSALSENAAAAGAGTAADLYHGKQRPEKSFYTAIAVATATTHYSLFCMYPLLPCCRFLQTNKKVTRACRFSGRLHMVATGATSVGLEYLSRFLQQYLYENGESTNVYLIVGGFLSDGVTPCLRELYPHGSSNDAAYAALGSGGMAALSVLEHGYDPNLSLHDAVDLAVTAVAAGIRHDLGSGSQVDVCVLRPHRQPAAFSRAVVPAEALPELPRPLLSTAAAALTKSNEEVAKAAVADAPGAAITETSKNNNNVVVPRGGVNGFGNVDFVVRSRKQLCWSQSIQERQILEQWKDELPKEK
jgi:hypothetical protein